MSDQTPAPSTAPSTVDPAPDPSLTDTNVRYPAVHADPSTADSGPKIPNVDGHGTVLGSADALALTEQIGADVVALIQEENEQGYRGHNPDPIPNEAYTLAGVTSGGPIPGNVSPTDTPQALVDNTTTPTPAPVDTAPPVVDAGAPAEAPPAP